MHFDLSKFLRALSSISNDTLKLPYGINCNAKVDSVDEVSKVTDIYKNGRVTHMYISINNINETLKFKQGFSYTSSPHINLYKLNNKRIPTTSIYLNNKENVYNQRVIYSICDNSKLKDIGLSPKLIRRFVINNNIKNGDDFFNFIMLTDLRLKLNIFDNTMIQTKISDSYINIEDIINEEFSLLDHDAINYISTFKFNNEWIFDDSVTHHIKTNYNPNKMDVFSELKKFDFKHNDYPFSDLSYTKNNIDSEFKRMLDVVNNKI